MTTEEKLKHFEEASIERAEAESITMISEYKASLKQLEDEHKAEKRRQADLQIKAETVSLKREKNKTLSKKQLEIRRDVTKKTNELKEKLFVDIKIKLEDYMDTPQYHELLIRQIKDILKYAGNHRVVIYIDPADSLKIQGLSVATNTPLKPSEYSFKGGTRAVIEDRHILIDNSFATKLESEKEEFTFDGGRIHE